jgi:hypothetical protein
MRLLELEADSREAAPREGARSMSTSALEVEHTHQGVGTRHHQRGGKPRREERHGLAALTLDQPPREIPRTEGFS